MPRHRHAIAIAIAEPHTIADHLCQRHAHCLPGLLGRLVGGSLCGSLLIVGIDLVLSMYAIEIDLLSP